jgi:hypothetical protein
MKIFLAHGILGPLDELFYLGPEIVFALALGLSWLRSRRARKDSPPPADENCAESAVGTAED